MSQSLMTSSRSSNVYNFPNCQLPWIAKILRVGKVHRLLSLINCSLALSVHWKSWHNIIKLNSWSRSSLWAGWSCRLHWWVGPRWEPGKWRNKAGQPRDPLNTPPLVILDSPHQPPPLRVPTHTHTNVNNSVNPHKKVWFCIILMSTCKYFNMDISVISVTFCTPQNVHNVLDFCCELGVSFRKLNTRWSGKNRITQNYNF